MKKIGWMSYPVGEIAEAQLSADKLDELAFNRKLLSLMDRGYFLASIEMLNERIAYLEEK